MMQALKLIMVTLMSLLFLFGTIEIFAFNHTDLIVKSPNDLISTTVTFKDFKFVGSSKVNTGPGSFTVEEYPGQFFVLMTDHPLVRFSDPDWQFKPGDKLTLTVPKKELERPKTNPVVTVNGVSLPNGKKLTGIDILQFPTFLYYIADACVIIPVLYFSMPILYWRIIQKDQLRIQNRRKKVFVWFLSVLCIFLVLSGIATLINSPAVVLPVQIETGIEAQIEGCWDIPSNLTAEQKIPVEVLIDVNRDHTIKNVKIVDQARFLSDRNFRTIANSALAAINKKECARLQAADDHYEYWKQIDFTFDPR